MSLVKYGRTIRQYLNVRNEYKVRNILWRLLPVQQRSPTQLAVHACVWKTASQYVRLVLTDPVVYRHSGLLPQLGPAWYKREGGFVRGLPQRGILTPIYASYEELTAAASGQDYRAIYIQRDPRDLLVSRYFSRLSAHPTEFYNIVKLRQELEQMSREDGLHHVLGTFEEITDRLRSWSDAAARDPRVTLFRFEEMTGAAQHQTWRAIFDHFQIELPDDKLRALLDRYSFQNLAGGRKRGDAKADHKYRKGTSGDWRNHFDEALTRAFVDKTGNLVEALGYRW